MGPDFPWYYSPSTILEKSGQIGDFQFTHGFYNKGFPNSEWLGLLEPLIAAINPLAIIRIKANMNPRSDVRTAFPFHTDMQSATVTTSVYYINSNDGVTLFEDGTAIESVANRIIRFDSSVPHAGTTCTNQNVRCVININYIAEEDGRA